MGQIGFFAIVEGRTNDRPFYDRLMQKNSAFFPSGYSIRLAEEITIDGRSAGGKAFACRMFELFREKGWLKQSNSQLTQRVGFFLDRDFEHLTGSATVSPHVIYTLAADVEAEIALHGRLANATGSAYSLTSEQVQKAIPDDDLMTTLAFLWRSWIRLLITAEAFGVSVPNVHHAGLSKVNTGSFGTEIPEEIRRIGDELQKAVGGADASMRIDSKVAEVDRIFESGQGRTLVKGKWIAAFIHHRVTRLLADEVIQSNVSGSTVFAASLETIDFGASWTTKYRDKLGLLMRS